MLLIPHPLSHQEGLLRAFLPLIFLESLGSVMVRDTGHCHSFVTYPLGDSEKVTAPLRPSVFLSIKLTAHSVVKINYEHS